MDATVSREAKIWMFTKQKGFRAGEYRGKQFHFRGYMGSVGEWSERGGREMRYITTYSLELVRVNYKGGKRRCMRSRERQREREREDVRRCWAISWNSCLCIPLEVFLLPLSFSFPFFWSWNSGWSVGLFGRYYCLKRNTVTSRERFVFTKIILIFYRKNSLLKVFSGESRARTGKTCKAKFRKCKQVHWAVPGESGRFTQGQPLIGILAPKLGQPQSSLPAVVFLFRPSLRLTLSPQLNIFLDLRFNPSRDPRSNANVKSR